MKRNIFLLVTCLLARFAYGEEPISLNEAFTLYLEKKSDVLEEYLRTFPSDQYRIKKVSNGFLFYVDLPQDMIKKELFLGKVWEPLTDAMIKRYIRPGSIVLDVGAHVGTHAMVMSQCVGKKGKVIAFEPQPKSFRELFMNMRLNHISNVLLENIALGSAEGKIELSPLPVGNEGMASCYGGSGVFVEMRKLDFFKYSNVSLIKIDVEGMEDEVLSGALKTIRENRPVLVIEILGRRGKEMVYPRSETKIHQTVKTLKSLGYRIFRYSNDYDFLAIPKGQDLKKADFWPEQ